MQISDAAQEKCEALLRLLLLWLQDHFWRGVVHDGDKTVPIRDYLRLNPVPGFDPAEAEAWTSEQAKACLAAQNKLWYSAYSNASIAFLLDEEAVKVS